MDLVTIPAAKGGMDTPKSPSSKSPLIVLELAYQAITLLRPIVESIRKEDRDLADQIRRAASSIALNLAESRGSRDGNRTARLKNALGSAHEVRSALRVAYSWGYVANIADVDAKLDRIAGMTFGLLSR